MPRLTILALAALPVFAQAPASPTFPFADIHPSPPSGNLMNMYRRGPTMRGGRYELRGATMLDLVSIAFSMDQDKVLGGPSWLEQNRYDIIAKAPAQSNADSLKPALRQLLEDRFHLVAHKETKDLPTFALVAGKKPLIKEASGGGESGCHPQAAPGGRGNFFISGADGTDTTMSISLGPGMTVTFNCRNVSIPQFVAGLRGMMFTNAGNNPVLDHTGLTGRYDFDLRWSINLVARPGDNAEHITFSDAIDHQLGLKLEPTTTPTPVLVVDSVDRDATPNVSDIAARLNIPPPPTEFDVAALKPADSQPHGMIERRVQPGGRVELEWVSVNEMIMQAWNLTPEMMVNAPSWGSQDRYDLIAKVSSPEELEMDQVWPLVRKLLEERFALKAHMEERPVEAWRLTAIKPKMKKADPSSRTHMRAINPNRPGAARPANTALTRQLEFQNTTMAEFAEMLQRTAGGYIRTPVADETKLEGGWDFTLQFSPAGMVGGRGGRGGRGGAAMTDASDPGGDATEPSGALSLPEAIEKELGLKLEQQKRPMQVLVIDSIERKPIDN